LRVPDDELKMDLMSLADVKNSCDYFNKVYIFSVTVITNYQTRLQCGSQFRSSTP